MVTWENLNVLDLGPYDAYIGMEWVEANRVKLDCLSKTFKCTDDEGNPKIVKGIPRVIPIRNY